MLRVAEALEAILEHLTSGGGDAVLSGITRLERGQERIMAGINDVRTLVTQINEKTNQMATDEQAEMAVHEEVKARLQTIIDGGQVPQDVVDGLTAAVTALDGANTTNAATVARLRSWGQDPQNPLP